MVWSKTKGPGEKLLNRSNTALSRLEAKQARRLIAVVAKLQLHLGYLTKGFQKGSSLKVSHESRVQERSPSKVASVAAL